MIKHRLMKKIWVSLALAGLVIAALMWTGGPSAQEQAKSNWIRIDPTQIQDNPVTLFGRDWMVLAAGNPGNMNAMTIGWGGLGTLWGMNKAVVTVYVEPSRYTHQFMEQNEYFTVTAFPDQYRNALQYIGTRSGRNEDKIANAGLTVDFTDLGNPLFNEGRLVIECKKIYAAPFNPAGIAPGTNVPGRHTMYIGEVVNTWVK